MSKPQTGRIPPRAGIYSYLPDNHVMHLRDEEITLAEKLRETGYHTGHFGKWHLSSLDSRQPGPNEQGFDHSLGTANNAIPSHRNPTNFIRNGKPVGKIEGYSCQIVVNETIEWIDTIQGNSSDAPFFACVWFHEPHTPIASPPELTQKYQRKFPQLNTKHATYYANIENVDRAVGRLLVHLDQLQLADDTLIFLTSDNGPLNRFSRQGLRGQKSNVWEGGHRVPGIFRWPGRIPSNRVCSVPISGVDFFPTICDLVNVDLPTERTLDGASLRPLLLENATELPRETPLYWFFYRLNPAIAIRAGKWSLIAQSNDSSRPKAHPLVREDMPHIKASQPERFQLFNLDEDLAQQIDVSKDYPEIFTRMRIQLAELHSHVIQEGFHWNIPADYGAKNNRRLWESE